ncbi:MAG: MvdC/MvdD family ATP grasp protein [Pseudonocardiaceae bacterium]
MTVAGPVVLVLGDAGDWSAAEVGKHLDARSVRWVLLDTADFPQRMSVDARLDTGYGGWQGEITIDGQTLRLAEVTAVYYRKPRDFDLPDGSPSTPAAASRMWTGAATTSRCATR